MVALVVLVGAIRGSRTSQESAAPSKHAVAAAFAGSPPALASLHARANRLISGGPSALAAELRRLHGHPVVINEWASWCEPCQSEFPSYQRAAVAFGREVAFIGVDGNDTNARASAFLRRFPVTYPSWVDPHQQIARSLQALGGYPQTIYLDRSGGEVYDHAGPYLTVGALKRDIRRYALG